MSFSLSIGYRSVNWIAKANKMGAIDKGQQTKWSHVSVSINKAILQPNYSAFLAKFSDKTRSIDPLKWIIVLLCEHCQFETKPIGFCIHGQRTLLVIGGRLIEVISIAHTLAWLINVHVHGNKSSERMANYKSHFVKKNVHLFANNMFDHFNQFTYEISIVTVWLDTQYKQIKLKHQTYNC